MTCGFAACYAERLGLSVAGERQQPLRAAGESSPSRLRGGERKCSSWAGKAEPLRTAGRQSRIEDEGFPSFGRP
jgi:hypothetical protein